MLKSFLFALSFLTRLPASRKDFSGIKLSQATWSFPIIGMAIGLGGGTAYLSLIWMSFSPIIAAWGAITFQILLTGALHEDGLADTADGLAATRSLAQRLEIMRDSRIGSYGVLALIIALSLRADAISGLYNAPRILFIFIAAGALSRAFIVLLMRSTPSTKPDGLAASTGRPSATQTTIALLIGFLCLLFAKPSAAGIFIFLGVSACFLVIRSVIRKNFGGITGDTIGAMQVIMETALLLLLSNH